MVNPNSAVTSTAVMASAMVALIGGSSRRSHRRYNLSMMMGSVEASLYRADSIMASMIVLGIGAGVHAGMIVSLREAGIHTVAVMIRISTAFYCAVSACVMMSSYRAAFHRADSICVMMGSNGAALHRADSICMTMGGNGAALHRADSIRVMVGSNRASLHRADHRAVIGLCRSGGHNSIVVGKASAPQHSGRAQSHHQ